MSNKNVKNETKNNVVTESTMSNEQMEQFVTEHIGIVPRNWKRKFEVLNIEQKVSKIHYYLDRQKQRTEAIEKNKLENRVKELFDKRKATTEDVVRVIDFCKQYIQATKEQEINKLQSEIERLTHLKQPLETN